MCASVLWYKCKRTILDQVKQILNLFDICIKQLRSENEKERDSLKDAAEGDEDEKS